VLRESGAITTALTKAMLGYRTAQKGWWPMCDIHSSDLVDFAQRRLRDEGLQVTMVGLPVWLHGDSHTLSLLLEALIRRIHADTGIKAFDVGAGRGGAGRDADKVWLEINWNGVPVPDETIEDWLGAPVSPLLGGMAVRDVLQHHGTDAPLQTTLEGFTWLRLPMQPGRDVEAQEAAPTEEQSSRPQFFDFDLLQQDADLNAELGLMPLRAITYVVFDTETTGLRPDAGDQIVSIAGVRIVNGRILTGESFNRIVNPGRTIPPESIKFHGITDDMVQDKPPLEVVLPQFKAFCADAVLVGHNVAFDLKFLRMNERKCGVAFDNPALDTMLLSAYVDDSNRNQTLDAISDRYGIHAADRHTALGDSLTTAAVLLRLIDALEARGIRTFDEAVKTLNITQQLQQRQAAFSGTGDQAGMSF
jgi:DNA polymerase-3 subunit epsilon